MGRTVCPGCARPFEGEGPLCPDCGAVPGRRLGPYTVVGTLGQGAMGLVLRGKDPALKRDVAIKVMQEHGDGDPGRRLRFIEEAQITGQLDHPGIAPVHLLGSAPDGSDYFSMKLVSGRTLGALLAEWHEGREKIRSEYPLPRLLSLFERIGETVSFAHERGILHRDLKPENVMIGTHGEVWVLDWGLARKLDAGESGPGRVHTIREEGSGALTLDGHTVGTPHYMAPEQARGEPLDPRADLYSLGAILFVILTGRSPVRGRTVEEMLAMTAQGRRLRVRSTGAGRSAPPALAAICEQCLATDRDDRYPDVEALLRDLRSFAAGEPVSARPDTFVDRILRVLRRHREGALAAAGGLILLLLVIAVASMRIASKDHEARQAEQDRAREQRRALEAELAAARVKAEAAARAQRRLAAFEPYAKAAELLGRGQLPETAAEELRRAVTIDPEFPEAWFARGEALRQCGLPGEAAVAYLKADALGRALAGRPNLQAVVAAGFAYDSAGEYALAEDTFQKAEREGSDDPLGKVGHVFRLGHHRKFREARVLAEETLRRAPHLWESHFAAGFALLESMREGEIPPDYPVPVRHLRRALELSPRQAEPCFWLALLQAVPGHPDSDLAEAALLLDRIISLEPKNGNRYLQRAQATFTAGDRRLALQDLEKGIALGAHPALAALVRSRFAYAEGRHEEAFEQLGESLRKSRHWPPNVGNWLVLGINLGKRNEIRDVHQRWEAENPDYSEVYVIRNTLRLKEQQFDAALKDLEEGLGKVPYNGKLLLLRAQVRQARKDWPEALQAADAAVRWHPRLLGAWMVRLQALAALGRRAETLDCLDRMIRDFPEKAAELERMRVQLKSA